jgi:hypothetical protein
MENGCTYKKEQWNVHASKAPVELSRNFWEFLPVCNMLNNAFMFEG